MIDKRMIEIIVKIDKFLDLVMVKCCMNRGYFCYYILIFFENNVYVWVLYVFFLIFLNKNLMKDRSFDGVLI